MILALRNRHRRIFVVIGVLLPIALAGGIAARKPLPSMESLPVGLYAFPQLYSATQWESKDLFTKTSIRARLLRGSGSGERFAVQFSAATDFLKPDLIVYWVAGNPKITNTLPGNARLLGAFSAEALPLHDDAVTTNGVLVIYSLANGEIVDVSKAFRFNDSTK
jgi:hypothetical protein